MRSVIDLCYTNMVQYYSTPVHLPGVGLSKHQVIVIRPSSCGPNKPETYHVCRRDHRPKAKQALKDAISKVHWEPVIRLSTCEEQMHAFSTIMDDLVNTFLPMKVMKRCSNDHPWISDEFRRVIQLRQHHHHAGNTLMYNVYRNKANRMRKQLKSRFYANKMAELQSECPRRWWQLIKDITGQRSPQNTLQGLANTTGDGSMAGLAEQINASLQRVTDDMTPLRCTTLPAAHVPSKYIIPVNSVEKQLSKIKVSKAAGPDNIPNWVLRDMAPELAPVICSIWNASFRDAFVPAIWKSADIISIPKVSPPMSVDKDLRPISLTPSLSKGLEFYARKWTNEPLTPVLDPHQFGSRANYSTVTALVHLIHSWLLELEKPGTVIRTLLIDYRKAFDRVDHTILVNKLHHLGLPDFLVAWYESFLGSRKQRVKLGDVYSDWAPVTAGVPQGTLTGPTAFLLHINDLHTVCPHIKYVDDTSIWESCNISGSNSQLQQAADQVSAWTEKTKMQLNVDKTKEMHIYFGKKPTTFSPVTFDDRQIDCVTSCKLLGVVINNKLTWDDHINYIIKKASKRLYFLRLLKRAAVNPSDIIKVFVSTVRSTLEYAAEVWQPGTAQTLKDKLEHIQKRALKIVYPSLSYSSALRVAGLETLEVRRELLCKNWFNKLCDVNHPLHHLLPQRRSSSRLRNALNIPLPKVRTERLKKSPIYYGIFKYQ